VKINITNVKYLVSGQFDVLYNSSVLNVVVDPPDGVINDTMRSCGNVTVDIDKGGIGGDWNSSGRLRIFVDVPWAQDPQDPCTGGNGSGPGGDGYLTTLTFKGIAAG